ncbi:ATP-binding cassette domain-containing protein [Rickettsiales endosymbiont of Peranema trichophorum]|uniref:ATP-binding cassette domain-containing protein n=1 Tax=Rickettsiales endosymbiont of Peranema trichophorum TaxID=2486577 RepID=UPI001023EBA1|nr:ATP-binding cassette domain-containing protein [Rickettsiales endosymbiont of Peranema trichophorum]RZI47309.1 ATP-binding cassette domain-containing protein [Rickettsiales endosymbiont of Peranema trichophorum]
MIDIVSVTKSFPGLSKPVLDGLTLSLAEGDFCILIGANGCGKSTLAKLINGEYKPDLGEIKRSGNVAQVVQDVNLGTIPDMSLLENIALSEMKTPKLLFYRRYKQSVVQKLSALGAGLEEYVDQPLNRLSGGQRQMVATLMAINSGSPILVLDEHTSALDPKSQSSLMQYAAQEIATKKLTTIMITHKMDDAIKYGNRLIMLHQGRIVVDMGTSQKRSISVQDLLGMFHKYEDQLLVSGEGNDN